MIGPNRRGQHAKSNGCLRAEFRIRDDVPEDLKVGVFSRERPFHAWVRFSNGFNSDDRDQDVHGIGIKLMNVEGAKILAGKESADTQDFLLADHPVFFAPDVRSATDFFSMKVEFDKQGVPPQEAFQALAKAYPRITPLFLEFVRSADPSPLQTQYWSQVPSLLGSRAVKYHVRPSATDVTPDVPPQDSPDFLREALKAQLSTRRESASLDFCIQIQGDPEKMPVEDPTVPWDSPWISVATIAIEPQEFDTEPRREFGENLSFSSWHSLPEHRPLGGIHRARREVYDMSSKLRHETNGILELEPTVNTDPGNTDLGDAE